MNNSLNHRKDVRSAEQFKKDIKNASLREKILMDLWVKQMSLSGHVVLYKDYGIDNSGEFVERSDSRPDYEVTIDNNPSFLLEIKSNPYDHKQTFKIHDLETYIKYNAKILLFYGLGKDKEKIDTVTARWAIIETGSIDNILKFQQHIRGDAKWGYKQVVIIYPELYSTYFESKELIDEK